MDKIIKQLNDSAIFMDKVTTDNISDFIAYFIYNNKNGAKILDIKEDTTKYSRLLDAIKKEYHELFSSVGKEKAIRDATNYQREISELKIKLYNLKNVSRDMYNLESENKKLKNRINKFGKIPNLTFDEMPKALGLALSRLEQIENKINSMDTKTAESPKTLLVDWISENKKMSKRLFNVVNHALDFKYVEDIDNSENFLSIRNAGKKTLIEFKEIRNGNNRKEM
jgi:FtsZ-binding cell division protein ZapB